MILDLPELCPGLTGGAYAAIADAMLLSSEDKGTYSTYSSQLKSIFGKSAGQSLYKKTKTMFASLLLEKSSAALEKNISSACPELTKEQIAKVRSAMTEAKRISPKNHTAGYGMTLMDIFPDPAVKKMVFTKTRGLLPQA